MDQNLDFVVHTFGCKVNTYDGGLIQKNLSQNGFKPLVGTLSLQNLDKSKNQIHILNTCAVTAEATKEAVRAIRKIKSQQPFSTVVVTGCAAQVDTGAFSDLPGADLVVANSHKGLLPDLLQKYFKRELTEKVFKSNIFKKEDLEESGGDELSHSRTFLKIQDGCNSFCTFCIIPYARGKSRSISIAHIVQKINEYVAQGQKEVVLTGVHIGDYEDENLKMKNQLQDQDQDQTLIKAHHNLDDLIENILEKTKIQRLRLSSLEPIEISDRMISLFLNPKYENRLCAHFHMSIQSADTEVLKQMKRKYTQSEVRERLLAISQIPQVFVGMDVIAGFPTETEEQFENTYQCLSELPWTRLHVFPYSERSGTRAATFEQIPFHLRKERAARLRELSLHRFQSEALKLKNTQQKVLILNKPSKGAWGLSRNYWPVRFDEASSGIISKCSGKEVDVLITDVNFEQGEGQLVGQLLKSNSRQDIL